MRLRSTIPAVTASALLAAVLAVPGQALADTPTPTSTVTTSASPSATATDSASSSASASTVGSASPSVTDTTTPTDSGSASASASATDSSSPSATPSPAAPNVTDITTVRTATGVELGLTASAPSDVTQLTATFTPIAGYGSPGNVGPTTVSTFTLISGTAQNGVWQTTGSLGLARGVYDVAVNAIDKDAVLGTASAASAMKYVPSPDFHGVTFAPANLGMGNETLTVKGSATLYDPSTGDTGAPFHDTSASWPIFLNWSKGQTNAFPDWNTGQFTILANPGPIGSDTFTLSSDPYYVTFDGPSSTVTTDQASPTRILLDSTSANGLVNGSSVTVSGTVQYQAGDGSWKPLVNTPVIWKDGTTPWGAEISATSDWTGRFALQLTVPASATTWHLSTPSAGDQRLDAFAQPSATTFAVQNVQQRVSLRLDLPSVNEFSDLSFEYTVTSTSAKVPGGRVYVLQSPNGSTGWKNLGYISVNNPVSYQQITAWVDNPHGYWKLWYPGAPGYLPAYSNVIHTFRYLTNITGGRPNTTHVHRGQRLHFTGGVWEQGMGNWFHVGAGWRVYLFFKPNGGKWQYTGSTTVTDRNGHWSLYGKAKSSGTWEVAWFTPDAQHLDAFGPTTVVRVN